jgi:hypothetical protein
VYATLTRVPAARRASGDQALLYIGDIRERFTIVTFDEQEYSEMLETSAAAGLI